MSTATKGRAAAYVQTVRIEVPVTLTGTEDEFERTMRDDIEERAMAYVRTLLPAKMRDAEMGVNVFSSRYYHPDEIGKDEDDVFARDDPPTGGVRLPLKRLMGDR